MSRPNSTSTPVGTVIDTKPSGGVNSSFGCTTAT